MSDVVSEYKKLLEVGRQRIKGEASNDLEQHAEFNKLLKLNDYVYTYYSTNEDDDTYSIEFIVLSRYLVPLLNKLRQKGLWFLAKDYGSLGGDIVENYDKKKNDETKPVSMVINASQLNRFILKDDKNPSGWEVISKHGNQITIEREQNRYFLESDNIAGIKKEYESGNYFLNMSFIRELDGDINIDLLSQNVAVVVIEDPNANQKTLYDVLFGICKQTVKFPQVSVKSRKSRTSASSKSRKSKSPNARQTRKSI